MSSTVARLIITSGETRFPDISVAPPPSEAEIFLKWFIGLVRTLVTLLIIAVLIGLVAPGFLRKP